MSKAKSDTAGFVVAADIATGTLALAAPAAGRDALLDVSGGRILRLRDIKLVLRAKRRS